MARKGSRKVRTGCLTCKIRKIKCDEGKPFCNRCTSTGRKCDGYSVEPASVLRWQRPQTLQIDSTSNDEESRALRYYCDHVAPFIAGPTDPYFWTHLVVQFTNFEPAVKHSVIAIGLLYGNIQTGVNPHMDSLALRHYNAAIYELKPVENKGLVLLVCVLFVCIELLQSNSEAAIGHLNHGVAILESSDTESGIREHLLPIFRRLCLLPISSRASNSEVFDPEICRCPIPTSFVTFAQAQSTIDYLFNQTMQLVRFGDEYRFGSLRHQIPHAGLLDRQNSIRTSLHQWSALWEDLDSRSKSATARIRGGPRIHALLKYEVSSIWADMAFATDESGYDQYLERFRQIVDQTSKYAESQAGSQPPHFLFEAGFTPFLFFIVSKCRALDIRLEALRLLATLGSPCEATWNKGELYCIARRLIELEHNISLDSFGQLQYTEPDSCLGLPLDVMRVRHFAPVSGAQWQFSLHGDSGGSSKVSFYMCTPANTLYLHEEVLGCEYYSDLSTLDGAYESYASSPGSLEG